MYHFTKDEEEVIERLVASIAGDRPRGRRRRELLLQKIRTRMESCHQITLEAYLLHLQRAPRELDHLRVLLQSDRAGSFFWESDQYDGFERLLLDRSLLSQDQFLRILVAACASGEEAYSLAIFLEKRRLTGRLKDYRIVAFDSDPKLVRRGIKGVYEVEFMREIPLVYRSYLFQGSGKTENLFTFDPEVRKRIQWFDSDILKISSSLKGRGEEAFHGVLCRGVLSQFDEEASQGIIEQFLNCLRPGGVICLGKSETIEAKDLSLVAQGKGFYRFAERETAPKGSEKKALVIDDSLATRRYLSAALSQVGFDVETVDSAMAATRYIQEHHVDLVTLDLQMPGIDGPAWLRQQRDLGLKAPVVIISDLEPVAAEATLGPFIDCAQDYVSKQELSAHTKTVAEKLKELAHVYGHEYEPQTKERTHETGASRIDPPRRKFKKFHPQMIVIASSTGGTEALVSLLRKMPPASPPVLIVQHITHAFAESFFERLAKVSELIPGVIKQDSLILPGHLYMSLGDHHIGVKQVGDKYKLKISSESPLHAVRPAADILFRSVARLRIPALAMILTGMGKDGAAGIVELKDAGCYTLAQDEDSCVVFGMPREAIEMGGIHFVGNLRSLRGEIDKCLAIPLRGPTKSA